MLDVDWEAAHQKRSRLGIDREAAQKKNAAGWASTGRRSKKKRSWPDEHADRSSEPQRLVAGAARVNLSHEAVHLFMYAPAQVFLQLRSLVSWRHLCCSPCPGRRVVLLLVIGLC